MATAVTGLARVRTTNSTDAAFPARPATVTVPADDGVIHLAGGGDSIFASSISDNIILAPFGTTTDNTTFSIRVIGWRRSGSALWVPFILCELACTLSASVGVAGEDVINTERFVDTITKVSGNEGISLEIFSPANDTPAHVMIDVKGCNKVEVLFDMTGAVSGNALWGGV